MAIGVLEEAEKLNIRVPDDLSVVGFDSIEILRFIKPALTTVRQMTYDMGKTAAEVLLKQIREKKQVCEVNIFPVEIVPGQTVKKIN
jgi:DNA-binding LacI/PurR family transcriptional regulator